MVRVHSGLPYFPIRTQKPRLKIWAYLDSRALPIDAQVRLVALSFRPAPAIPGANIGGPSFPRRVAEWQKKNRKGCRVETSSSGQAPVPLQPEWLPARFFCFLKKPPH